MSQANKSGINRIKIETGKKVVKKAIKNTENSADGGCKVID